MVIFGTRDVRASAGRGHFHCPSCGSRQPHEHKRVRRFFAFFSVPLIPLGELANYVECDTCRRTFEPEVLRADPPARHAQVEAHFHKAIRRVMVEVMMVDGAMGPNEVRTVRDLYGRIAGSELSEREVWGEISQAKREPQKIEQALGSFAGRLDDAGKEIVIEAAYRVATSDGELKNEERELMSRIASGLEMTPAHLQRVISGMSDDA